MEKICLGKNIVLSVGAMALMASCAFAGDAARSDGEVWNEGLSLYESGDVTNALAVLEGLLLSKTHGARAADIVGKIRYDRKGIDDLEEAAKAAQVALRAAPTDARANRNFTRAADRLPELREARRLETVLKAAQGQDPGAILKRATDEARLLLSESGSYRTNAAARAVALSDALSSRATHLADQWLPVRETIAQAVTNEAERATIIDQLNQAQAKTKRAAKELSDLDEKAYSTLADVEGDFTRYLKLTILPPAAIGEDEISQTNAWIDVEPLNGRAWQGEALDYTRAFRAKFPAWARAYEQQAQSDTNKPPFKPEDQAKVSALATELEKLQLECQEKALPSNQEQALDLIRKIRELLPKDKSSGGGQGQPQANPQQQNDQKKDDQKKDDQQQQQQQQQNQDQQEQPRDDEKKEGEANEQEKEEDQEVEAVLKKAQERNDEHEADKKARMRKTKLPPNERDW